ncbi:tyrosine protein phosphatase [Trichoderma citrinoviride]|uniref:protein-tyrosine-phosphatase n=1 Tax=Trichoderma citrinoviride TaxID=58853 RepID=A0A2T4B1J3_9HYPO|nr:tyrosine protein phosphatase [Trichoderma citrinoviride]PTB63170.1 tyrosine protein phosphatase [Trichoderma citrinoviride]
MALSTIEGVPNLYVGGLWALRRSQSLLDRKITHVLSLVSFNPSSLKNFKDEPFSEYGKPFKHLLIDIDDVEDSDLLIELPRAVKFIDEGLRSGRSQHQSSNSDAVASVVEAVESISLDASKEPGQSTSNSAAAPAQTSNSGSPPRNPPKRGAVFVHCAAGKSRSISAIIAYLLWRYPDRFTGPAGSQLAATLPEDQHPEDSYRSFSEPVRAALALIKQTRPLAGPNTGFMAQLDLWWQMGCPADGDMEAQPIYQRWLYQRAARESLAVGQAPSQLWFEDEAAAQSTSDPSASPLSSSSLPSSAPTADRKLRCKKCRRILATGPFIVPHQPRASGTTEDDGDNGVPSPPPPPSSPLCQHFFVEPLSWMRAELEKGELSGRLACPNPKCGAGVGRYDWKGFPCSCGAREDPAFSLQKARVEEEVSRAALRMPPGRGGSGSGSKGNL